jgi:hypothetical protein
MKTLIILTILLLSYIIYGFYISQFELEAIRSNLEIKTDSPFHDYKGLINIHTKKSFGSGLVPQINEEAKVSGADFLMYTDFNVFDNEPTPDAYDGRLLVLGGIKYSYLDSRLIYYSPGEKHLGFSLGEAQTALADLVSQDPSTRADSLVVLAHPFLRGFEWSGDWPEGFDGIEILNTKSMAARAWNYSKVSSIWTLFVYPFNPQLALFRLFLEPSRELGLLDQLSLKKRVFAFAGSEASARAIPWAGYLIRFPSYHKTFELLSQHVLLESELTGHLQQDKIKIFEALKRGQFYICLDLLGNPRGFYTYLTNGVDLFPMGSEVKWHKNLFLRAKLPEKPKAFFEIVVFKNGQRFKTVNTPELEIPVDGPGVYRLQVRVAQKFPLPDATKWMTWIYGNPFYVKE